MGCAPAPCWSRRPCPRRDFVVLERAPAHHPALNHPHPGQACGLLARQRLAGHFLDRAPRGGAVLPPAVTCSRSILRVPGCRRPAGDSGPTVETPRPARRRSVERLAAAGRRRACIEADKGAGCARCGAVLEPVAVPPPRFRGPSNPPPRPSPSPCPQPPLPRTAGGSCTPPRGISESIPEPQPTSLPRPPPVNQLRFANSGRRRGPRILRRPSQWVRSRICRRRRWR